MDQVSTQKNEHLLGQFLDSADKEFVGQVGIIALGLLTERMNSEEYQLFLSECVDNAMEFKKHKILNAQSPTQVQK